MVLDADSADRTREVAQAAGALVIRRRPTDFVDARRHALGHVETPWTFMLDADERLDQALRAALETADPDAEALDGYEISRATRFCGATVTAFGWDDERLLRVFRTRAAILEAHAAAGGAAGVHESWRVPGRIGCLGGTLIHESYPNLASYRRKFERYTTMEAAGLKPNAGRLLLAAFAAPARFVWLLGPRGGMRAGWRGVYLAFWSALYPLVVHLKAARR